jgi:hypothetical protein
MTIAGRVARELGRAAAETGRAGRETARVAGRFDMAARRTELEQNVSAEAARRSRHLHASTALALRHEAALAQTQQPREPVVIVDGAWLFGMLRLYLSYYVAFPSEAALNLVTAWIMHAVARERDDSGLGQLIWRASPRLLITSRRRKSGKSTLGDLILILTQNRRGRIPKLTAAKLAKIFGQYFETAVLDEAKLIFGAGNAQKEVQGMLLAGYTRRASYEVNNKSLWVFGAAVVIAKEDIILETGGMDGPLGDLFDRMFKVVLAKPRGIMPEVDEQAEEDGEGLAEMTVTWTNAYRPQLLQAVRDLAEEDQMLARDGEDPRRLQIGRPLRAIARVCGPEVEAMVTDAIREITSGTAASEAAQTIGRLDQRAQTWRSATPCFTTEDAGEDDDLDEDEDEED